MVSRSRNKKKTNESVKRELLNLLQDIDDVEEQELNETANNVNYSQQIIVIICRYLDIIKTQSKNAIGHIGKKGEILKKFKDTEILKTILKLLRLFAKKTQFFCIDNFYNIFKRRKF